MGRRFGRLLIFLFLLFSAKEAYCGYIDYEASFSKKDITFTEVDACMQVALDGCSKTMTAGLPAMPVKNIRLLIPSGSIADSIKVIDAVFTEIANILPLSPVTPNSFPGYPPVPHALASKVPEAEAYPDSEAGNLRTGVKSGYSIVSFSLFPLKMAPSSNNLLFAEKISVRIFFHDLFPRAISRSQRDYFENSVAVIVENPEDTSIFRPSLIRNPGRTKGLLDGECDLLIVTSSEFADIFDEFVNFKNLRGIKTSLVPIESICAVYPGRDDAEKLRNFLIEAQGSWGVSFALLAGQGDYENSQEVVPRRNVSFFFTGIWPYPDGDTIPSDLYFSDLDGDWDYNGNGIFGEDDDNVDLYGDIFVGRAPVFTAKQCSVFVSKAMDYENGPPAGFVESILLSTGLISVTVADAPCTDIISAMVPPSFKVTKLYEISGSLTRESFTEEFNRGYGFVHSYGEGDENGLNLLYGGQFFSSSDVENLCNGSKMPICNASVSMAGALDLVSGGNSFAENLLLKEAGGGIASVFNTRYGWTMPGDLGPSDIMDTTFFSAIFRMNLNFMGEINSYTKDSHAPEAQYSAYFKWCLYSLNFWGDPSMRIYTREPRYFTVSHNEIATENQYFNVYVFDASSPVKDVTVTLMGAKDKNLYARGVTDAAGKASIYINPAVNGDTMYVTAVGNNYYPYYGRASVQFDTPPPPEIITPFSDVRFQILAPSLTFKSSDLQGDSIDYMICIDSTPEFLSADTFISAVFPQSETASFKFPVPLKDNSTFYAKVQARDPSGTNLWGGFSKTVNFSVSSALAPLTCSWFQTDAMQFASDSLEGCSLTDNGVTMAFLPSTVSDTLFFEDFESGSLESSWICESADSDTFCWRVSRAGNTDLGGYDPPSSGNYYAFYSDDDAGEDNPFSDEYLSSPSVPVDNALPIISISMSFSYGFTWSYGSEGISAYYNVFKSGAWLGWTQCFNLTDDASGAKSANLTHLLPFDSVRFKCRYYDGGAWGWAAAFDNIAVIAVSEYPNTLSQIVSPPVSFRDLCLLDGRTSWGNALWTKQNALDSILLRLEYCENSLWMEIPDSVLAGNGAGFYSKSENCMLPLFCLDETVYDSLRMKAVLLRSGFKSTFLPALLSWELGCFAGATHLETSDVSAICEDGKVILKWSYVSDSRTTGYFIYRSIGSGAERMIYKSSACGDCGGFVYEDCDDSLFGRIVYRIIVATESGSAELPKACVYADFIRDFKLSSDDNIFSSSLEIEYAVPQDCRGSLKIMDKTGRILIVMKDGEMKRGSHKFTIERSMLPSGMYFIKMNAPGVSKTLKIIRL